jgi:hypothetical protein
MVRKPRLTGGDKPRSVLEVQSKILARNLPLAQVVLISLDKSSMPRACTPRAVIGASAKSDTSEIWHPTSLLGTKISVDFGVIQLRSL